MIGFSDEDYLYVLGDAIDRGKDGVRLLKHIMLRPNMDLILGNHEFMMLNSVEPDGRPLCTGEDTSIWLGYNGGRVTLNDYIALSANMRKRLLGWLKNRFVVKTVEAGGKQFCLAHSYFTEELMNKRFRYADQSQVYDAVWNSIYRENSWIYDADPYSKYEYTFVTGHVPVQIVKMRFGTNMSTIGLNAIWRDNMVDIDGGCAGGENFYDPRKPETKNGLIFLRLDDLREFPVPF